MGMDLVELALEIEERYVVEFDENDWADMLTFGDMIDMVKRKIDRPIDLSIEESGHEIILQSLLAELRLRLPQNVEINEETQLRKLRRYAKNYKIWSFVQQRFPELPSWDSIGFRQIHGVGMPNCFECCSGIVIFGLLMLIMLIAIFNIIFGLFGVNQWTVFVSGLFLTSIVLMYLYLFVRHQLEHRTVGDVAKAIAERRQKLLKVREYSSDDIENELRNYMSKTFALKPEKILRESELVKDLGLD